MTATPLAISDLYDLVQSGDVLALGEKRWRRCRLKNPNDHGKRGGQ